MQREEYLRQLLADETAASRNQPSITFLKKFILLCHLGRLRINGQSPNRAFHLSQYLLDDRRMLLDWSRLDKTHYRRLMKWLILEHQHHFKFRQRLAPSYLIDESRGKPEEIRLGFWRRLFSSSLFRSHPSLYFETKLFQDEYQLNNIDLCLSKNGMLVDLVSRFHVLPHEKNNVSDEYQDEGDLQNVKRLILTNSMVDSLFKHSIDTFDFDKQLTEPHPDAIDVISQSVRDKRIAAFRHNHRYVHKPSFIWRLLVYLRDWFMGWARVKEPLGKPKVYQELCSEEDIQIRLCAETGEVQVIEKRPETDTLVLSGGGAKVFAQLGALKALIAAGVNPKRYAGSSAGAILAMLLYLGYSIEEIEQKFQGMSDRILIRFNISMSGLSTTDHLKNAIVYLVRDKILQIIRDNPESFKSAEAQAFLDKEIHCDVITFNAVKKLKEFCPNAPIGDDLVVTATNASLRETVIFSTDETPNMELAEAVKISGSLPFLYKHTPWGPFFLTDGGVLTNLPLSAVKGDVGTLLEHEDGANLGVLALQFDNGYENDVIYSAKDVYREGRIKNFIYGLLTGVKDPVSAWVRERWLLRTHACQSIIIPIGHVNASRFDLSKEEREQLIENGRIAALDYLGSRVSSKAKGATVAKVKGPVRTFFQNMIDNIEKTIFNLFHSERQAIGEGDRVYEPTGSLAKTQDKAPKAAAKKRVWHDLLYKSFENLEELLCFCAYRNKWSLLKTLTESIEESELLSTRYKETLLAAKDELLKWKSLHEKPSLKQVSRRLISKRRTTLQSVKETVQSVEARYRTRLYVVLFPTLSLEWSKLNPGDGNAELKEHFDLLEQQRLKLNRNRDNSVKIMRDLTQKLKRLGGEMHIIFYIYRSLILSCSETFTDNVLQLCTSIFTLMTNREWLKHFDQDELIGNWSFNDNVCQNILDCLTRGRIDKVKAILFPQHLKTAEKPQSTISTTKPTQIIKPVLGVNLTASV